MAEKEYQNLLDGGERNDLGLAIQNLINDNLKYIKTAYLAKITAINGNKVSIKPLLKHKQDDAVLIVNNCMVAFPYSQHWQEQFKLKVGDIGLALVIENDISNYKKTGAEGLNATGRFKDVNDSIYIPLSLYTTLENQQINYKLENSTKVCRIEFLNSEDGEMQAKTMLIKKANGNAFLNLDNADLATLKGKLLTLQSETTTLKKKFGELANLLEGMAGGVTSATGHGHVVTTSPSSIGKFNAWFSSLDSLFKD